MGLFGDIVPKTVEKCVAASLPAAHQRGRLRRPRASVCGAGFSRARAQARPL
jgi:hypothetical protein